MIHAMPGDGSTGSNGLFSIGQIVHHRNFDYRGVVFDVDPTFQGTDDWYAEMAISRPPKDRPWYHVLVDGAAHITYVAERNLESVGEADRGPVRHPLVADIFERFEDGKYLPRGGAH